MMEKSKLAEQSTDGSKSVTPKSIRGSNKLRQDLTNRVHEASLQEQQLILKKEAENYQLAI